MRSCQKSRKMWLDKCVHKLSADRLSMLKNNLFPELTISLLQQFSGIKTSLFYIVCSENFYSPVPQWSIVSMNSCLQRLFASCHLILTPTTLTWLNRVIDKQIVLQIAKVKIWSHSLPTQDFLVQIFFNLSTWAPFYSTFFY